VADEITGKINCYGGAMAVIVTVGSVTEKLPRFNGTN
jgi:hypothetical protein